jgi:hypothetical protein
LREFEREDRDKNRDPRDRARDRWRNERNNKDRGGDRNNKDKDAEDVTEKEKEAVKIRYLGTQSIFFAIFVIIVSLLSNIPIIIYFSIYLNLCALQDLFNKVLYQNASIRDIQHIRPFAQSAHATIGSALTQPLANPVIALVIVGEMSATTKIAVVVIAIIKTKTPRM